MHIVGKVLSFLLLLKIIGICIAPCPEVPATYTHKPADEGQRNDTGLSILNKLVKINCCGFITQWETYAYFDGTVNAQVWRLNGGSYQLIGYNTLSVIGGNGQVHTVNAGERIRVDVNDLIGMQSTGSFPLRTVSQSANTKGSYVTGMTSDISLNTIWPPVTPEINTGYEYGLLATVNASTPTFTDLSSVWFYNHAMTAGMVLKTLDGTQNDPGDLTFEIPGGSSYFTIDAGSNNITLISTPPPKGNYTVTVRVTDPCGASTDGDVVIYVLNQPPTIHNLDNTIAISEDTAPSTLIFSVNATDAVTDPVLCSLVGTNTVLDVQSADNGVYLKSGAVLDYDVTSSYSIDVSCTDNEDPVTATLTVNLIRNEPPVINSLPDSVSFLEDVSTRTLLHTLNVTDPTNDPVTCVLDPTSAIFDVSYIPPSTDYGIYLTGGTTLDYDTTSSYSLPVKCQDNRRNDTETFTVNLIRNTPPSINNLPDSTSISENLATRSLLLTLNVTDVNADVVTCSLSTFNSLFEIVKIGTSDDYGIFLKGGTTLDYDITPSYELSITCADHRRNDSDVFTVYLIRNDPPTILNLPKSLEIAEATSSETLLWTVSVTDPTNDTITCSAVSSSIFRIENGASGLVSESKVYLTGNAGLHYDTQKSYVIDITCADQRRNDTSTLYVYVKRNMPPYFTNLQDKTAVLSTLTAGQPVFTAQALDPENDQLQYSMTSQQANVPFVINQNTGEITLTRSIKYESVTGYDLLITVSDGRNTNVNETLTILITGINSAPSFRNLPQSVTVLEGTTVGSTVFQPAVDDKDATDVHLYSAIMSPPEGAVYFHVNKTTGSVTIIKDLDYETIPMKTFLATITVTDSLMEDTQNLTLNILNVNEAPRFTKKNYAFTVSENIKGTVLQNPYYEYNDQDGDTVMFSFNCGESTGLLDMVSATGFFSYAVDYDLDAEGMTSLIQCQVYVSDNEYTDTAYLNITVLDANDNSPRFEHSEYTFYMPISTSIGSTMGQVLATDLDTGIYGNILYHLDQETLDTGLFTVSSNGLITLANSIDTVATEGSVLNMTVYAVDEGGNQDVTYVNVVIPDTTVQQGIEDNTIQYFTFFTYAPNMAWFVPAIVASVVAISFPVYLILKYGCCDIRDILKECTEKKKNTRSQNFSTRRRGTLIYASWNPWKVWERN